MAINVVARTAMQWSLRRITCSKRDRAEPMGTPAEADPNARDEMEDDTEGKKGAKVGGKENGEDGEEETQKKKEEEEEKEKKQ